MSAHPVPAATLVVGRPHQGRGIEILLVRRPASAAAFAAAHVFPGGRLDQDDYLADASEVADGIGALVGEAARAGLGLADLTAHALAAVRELFEETGVLAARRLDGHRAGPTDVEGVRRLVAGGARWIDAVRARGLRLALDALAVFSHWTTPTFEPRRFDTWFFLMPMPHGQEPVVDGTEVLACEWWAPADAVAAHDDGRIRLAPPTLRTLEDLAAYREVSVEAIAARLGGRRVPELLPHLVEEGGRRWLVLPGDPWYPPAEEMRLPPPARFLWDGDRWRSAPAKGSVVS
jgi:8-oxo-dGTP pyrophosphatase MutT (NUDIX family)